MRRADSDSVPQDCPATVELPIACSLTGADRDERSRWLERLRARSTSARRTPSGMLVRFPAEDELEADLRALARAEAECCPFLRISVTRGRESLELAVGGPPDARALIDELLVSFSSR
jgi:hypothetical protein